MAMFATSVWSARRSLLRWRERGDGAIVEVPDTEEFINRLFESYGGAKQFLEVTKRKLAEFNALWTQDIDSKGRVLRSHLIVEFYMTAYLQKTNPNLGSIDDAKIGFGQKVELLGEKDLFVKTLIPGVRRLNAVRNRLAHNLSVRVTQDDVNAFMSIGIYKAIREKPENQADPLNNDPLEVYDDFAMFVAGIFHHGSSEESKYWRDALASKQAQIHEGI